MFLAIDVGGTKTLLAVFDNHGKIMQQSKLATAQEYPKFINELKNTVSLFKEHQIVACCCALPGRLDRERGVGLSFGNLAWENVPIKRDISKLLDGADVMIENDAKLAALSEALNHKEYKKIVYITIGTGIGFGIIINGKIEPEFADSEIGHMVLNHNGKLQKWESFASGKALKERYGKQASEIDDPAIWKEYVDDLVIGFDIVLAAFQPELVIVGGGVGAHFNKFGSLLIQKLQTLDNKLVPIPPIIQAQRPEDAVIYGCYDFIRQKIDAPV
ncbi:ROK family protein [Candidatus Saccharibacteria bacterium]|nr:ROK family protein [Candidatus Saccharibacteria bacterium]